MNGAESLVHTLLACGVDTCFANPGTSEMHFVAALDRIPGMRCVLGLFEGVVTGAADGYARMQDRPAATLLHCGPGLANGLANLHNARRARSPIVNLVGDQATYHRPLDAPLTADTEGFARPVSAWTRTAAHAATVGSDCASAVQAARSAPGGIATLILPSDTCWDDGGVVGSPLPVPAMPQASPDAVQAAVRALRSGEPALLLLGGMALRADPLDVAAGILVATGARMLAQTSNNRIARGAGRAPINRVPYPVDQAVAALAGVRHLILVGAVVPVGFFAYPNKPSLMAPPDCQVHVLARPEHDAMDALNRVADALGAEKVRQPHAARPLPARGAITSEAVAQTLAALLPDNAIIVDESVSFGRAFFPGTHVAAPHDWLQLTGGAIGCGIPLATGAAIGAPGRGPAGGRLGNVYVAGPVDPGAGAAGCHDGDPRQPQVRHPARRIPGRGREPWPHRARHARPWQPRPRLGAARERHGRGGRPRRHDGGVRRPVQPGQRPARSVRDRVGGLGYFADGTAGSLLVGDGLALAAPAAGVWV